MYFKTYIKGLKNILRPFEYKNMCELCDRIKDKENRGKIMVKKFFVLHKEAIDVFHNKFFIPTIKNCHFILIMLGFLVQWNLERLEIIFHHNASKKDIKLKNDYAEQFIKTTGIEIQGQHWGGNRQLSM